MMVIADYVQVQLSGHGRRMEVDNQQICLNRCSHSSSAWPQCQLRRGPRPYYDRQVFGMGRRAVYESSPTRPGDGPKAQDAPRAVNLADLAQVDPRLLTSERMGRETKGYKPSEVICTGHSYKLIHPLISLASRLLSLAFRPSASTNSSTMAVGPRLTDSAKSLSIFGGYFVFAGLVSFYFKEVLYLCEAFRLLIILSNAAHDPADAVPSCITGILFGPLVGDVINPFE